MGFGLSVLYFVIYFLTPAYLLGPAANWHIQQIIVLLVFFASIPALIKSHILKTPQTLALFGLACSVFLASLIGRNYLYGGVTAFENFIPNGVSYFLISLHCTTKKRIQIIVASMCLVCLIIIANGFHDLVNDVANSGPAPEHAFGEDFQVGATASPYILRQSNDQGDWTYRIQGLGEINDPNDFAQVLVSLVPLMCIFWRPKKTLTNVAFVVLPICALLSGIYLTHSRGSLLALTAVLFIAGRKRIGTVASSILGSCLFLGAMAMQFTGGRGISASSGEDRTALWGQGMAIFKSHPFFGVGFGHLWEHTNEFLTAHNSIIVCAGELGLFGFFFWCLYLFPTIRDALAVSSPANVSEVGSMPVGDDAPLPGTRVSLEPLDKSEINRLGKIVFLSLVGFLVAGWFLSRAFVVSLFLIGGLAECVYEMALQRGIIAPRLPFLRVLRYTAITVVVLLSAMYILVRILNLIH